MRYVSPDHRLLLHVTAPAMEPLSEEEQERKHDRCIATRDETLRAVRGCHNTCDLVLRYFQGEFSLAEMAVPMGVNRSTAYRKLKKLVERFRWGRVADVALASFSNGAPFAYDARDGVLIRSGYSVALPGERLEFKRHVPTFDRLMHFLLPRADRLKWKQPPKILFSGGITDCQFHVDLSVLEATVGAAIELARGLSQESVLDLATGKAVPVDARQRRAA